MATSTDSPCRKFGKQIQKRQLEVPEYAASFVNYKALKKVRRSQACGYFTHTWREVVKSKFHCNMEA